MEGDCVETALALLRKAGRMDLVNQEALTALHPARKAAQGVVAVVLTCSPPRSSIRAAQVRRPGRAMGRASTAKVGRVVSMAAGIKKGGRALLRARRGGAGGAREHNRMRRERGRPEGGLGALSVIGGLGGSQFRPVSGETVGEAQQGWGVAVLSWGFWLT
ncbi:hypothetical protein NDU88_005446 [Pleurodeles waltl]|uniref:Uncharacterized protein n=1 Tax=Pleurodeles waltl TaxID=8319 RepID=A0AAV7LP40_PLEWA|nr:hypothetical protein NDU88_005446 [Pleurodeles waltl]